jgi:hypothetical protein
MTAKTPKAPYRPADGICRHRTNGAYDCKTPVAKPGWTWCQSHVDALRAAKKAAASKVAKPKPAAKVVDLSSARKPAPRPAKAPVARVPASVAALVVPTVEKL